MGSEERIHRHRGVYAQILRLHPRAHRERFSESMEQTFADLLRERTETGGGMLGSALWMYAETLIAIFKERLIFFMQSKIILRPAIVTAVLLMIPLIAMQFTSEVQWTLFDFAIMGALIFGLGFGFEFAASRTGDMKQKIALGIASLATFFLVWINLAVGIIGEGPINALYLLVFVVGFLGAIITRLRPQGMMYVLFAMAVIPLAVPIIGLFVAMSEMQQTPGIFGVFVLSLFFTVVFAGSGLLYRESALIHAK